MGAHRQRPGARGLRPYVGTFLVFSDYMRPAMRLAALMQLPVVYVFTHDSIGLGQDGPTHQPIEQLAAPARHARHDGDPPRRRQRDGRGLARGAAAAPARPRSSSRARRCRRSTAPGTPPAAGVARGGYVLADAEGGAPQVILMASGSEVTLCVEAQSELSGAGRPRPGGLDAVVGAVRGAADRAIASRCCRRR